MDFLGDVGGGCTPSPNQMGCRGDAIFIIKQENMIQCLSIMIDSFITADSFSSLDVWTV